MKTIVKVTSIVIIAAGLFFAGSFVSPTKNSLATAECTSNATGTSCSDPATCGFDGDGNVIPCSVPEPEQQITPQQEASTQPKDSSNTPDSEPTPTTCN